MLIKIKVFPGSHQNEVIEKSADQFVVKIKAKPQGGLANRMLLEVMADYWQIPVNEIRIIRGFKRKNKILEIKK